MTAGFLPPVLLYPAGLPGISVLYVLTLVFLVGFWLFRVAREARQGRLPRRAWWFIPGLLTLLLARMSELPALFGIGIALLLLAEYWPRAYQAPRSDGQRPHIAWPLFGVAAALGLITSSALSRELNLATLLTTLTAGLAGIAGLLTVAFFPRRQPVKPPSGFALRWQKAQVPEWPEFHLSLTQQGAQLTNASPQPLKVVGWSPRSINAWLPPRNDEGRLVEIIQSGQSAFLPLSPRESGLRVWYTTLETPTQARLFRADWVPDVAQPARTLN